MHSVLEKSCTSEANLKKILFAFPSKVDSNAYPFCPTFIFRRVTHMFSKVYNHLCSFKKKVFQGKFSVLNHLLKVFSFLFL